MSPARVRWIVLGATGCLIVAALWLNATSPEAEAEREAETTRSDGPSQPLPTVTIDAHTAQFATTRSAVDVAGVLEAVRAVEIVAEVEGRVISVDVEDHQNVEAGQRLVQLDPALPESAVKRAQAALLRAKASDRLARAELQRRRDLEARGATSGADLERAEAEAESAAAQVAESSAALIDARTRLAKTSIEAPFGGVISAIDADPGTYLRPGNRIAELADLSEIEIKVGVSEQEILAMSEGARVTLSVAALPGEWFEGHVTRLGRIPDTRTRRYPVPVRVPNTNGRLLPGMLGTVRFELGKERAALRVPSRAVAREFDLEFVYVLERGAELDDVATAVRRRVTTQPVGFRPDLLEVTSGMEGGELIAISGVRELRDGLRVRARTRTAAEMAGDPAQTRRAVGAPSAPGS